MMRQLFLIMCAGMCLQMQAQVVAVGLSNDAIAAMHAAKIHQDSIDVSSLVVEYDYECRTQDADNQSVTDRMKLCLQIGQHCTRSFPYRKFRKDQERDSRDYMGGYEFTSDEGQVLLKMESYCFMPEVWTNYPDGQTTVRDAVLPSIFETQEERKPINWTLSEDTMTIGGYLCKTASCELHGRQWTVHYCEDIPTSAGPWKLCGLPGLILEASDHSGIHRFILSNVQHIVSPIFMEHNAITSKMSEAKLIKKRIKIFGNKHYPKNPLYHITDLQSMDGVYCDKGKIENGVFVSDTAHVYQPLELK